MTEKQKYKFTVRMEPFTIECYAENKYAKAEELLLEICEKINEAMVARNLSVSQGRKIK